MDELPALAFALLLSCSRTTPADRVGATLAAIDEATRDTTERAVLVVVSNYETGLGLAGVPFGTTDHGTNGTLVDHARVALRIWRRSAYCGSFAARFGYYHHGDDCAVDAYAAREARTLRRLLAMVAQ